MVFVSQSVVVKNGSLCMWAVLTPNLQYMFALLLYLIYSVIAVYIPGNISDSA